MQVDIADIAFETVDTVETEIEVALVGQFRGLVDG